MGVRQQGRSFRKEDTVDGKDKQEPLFATPLSAYKHGGCLACARLDHAS